MLSNQNMFLAAAGLLLLGGLLSLAARKAPRLSIFLGYACAALATILGGAAGIIVLATGHAISLILPWTMFGIAVTFKVGPLSAFFITLVSVVGFAVSVFSYGYAADYIKKHNVGVLGLLYNLFIFSMFALLASDNALAFLFFWEVMSLVSYFLVVSDHHNSTVRNAGFIYAVMTHVGTIFITAAFMLLYKQAGSFSFTGFADVGPQLPAPLKTVIFLLATVGFGTKAGIVPLHVWLPRAHPAAPSNVSAIMSGVMLKTAIYGFIKIVIDILGGGPVWWGVLILGIGGVSALLGVMYALMEHDIKRLLAYHSVENIGIILMGIGSSLVFMGLGDYRMAMVGLTAGLFHTLNHAIFKGLLFLGAGSVQFSVRTRDIEKMGGLLKRMPWTGFFFLIGAVSISALPPFNGFVSEWLTFQSLLTLGSGQRGVLPHILGPLAGAVLALTGALAAACFVKAFGIQFLALPRSENSGNAREVPVSMRAGMGFLALLCFVLGVGPFLVISLLDPVMKVLLGVGTAAFLGGFRWSNVVSQSGPGTAVSPIALFALLAGISGLLYLVTRAVGRGGAVRVDDTWNCGMNLSPEMEYTATSFSKPIRIIFRKIFQPQREIHKEYNLNPYFTTVMKYKGSIKPVFEDMLYRPVTQFLMWVSGRIRSLQSGSIHLYLGYIFATLVILLIFAR